MDRGAKRTLLATIQQRETAAVTDIAEALDAHPVTVDRRCSELQRRGYVRRTATGVYLITEAGEEHLRELTE